MPPRRTFSDVNQELEAVKATADRLRRERNQAQDEVDTLGSKYQKVKKALKAKTKPVSKKKIPKPPGQAGRKPIVDKNGRKRNGYSLQDAMNLNGEGQRAIYLDFRSLVVGNLPKDRYETFDDIPTTVRGSICAKVLKKYPWLDDFQAHWPVDDVLRGNFSNRTSYRKDRDNGSLARRRRARKEGQGGGSERVDMDEDEIAMLAYDDANLGGDGYDFDRAGEAGNETSDEEEEDRMPRVVSRRKRTKIIESDEEEEEELVEDKQLPLISRKRKHDIDEEQEEDARQAIRSKKRSVPSRAGSPPPSRNPSPAPAPLRSPSPLPVPSRGSSASLSPAPSNPPTRAVPVAKVPTQPTNKTKKIATKHGAPTATNAGPRRSGRKK